jgi:hypothetical protein
MVMTTEPLEQGRWRGEGGKVQSEKPPNQHRSRMSVIWCNPKMNYAHVDEEQVCYSLGVRMQHYFVFGRAERLCKIGFCHS